MSTPIPTGPTTYGQVRVVTEARLQAVEAKADQALADSGTTVSGTVATAADLVLPSKPGKSYITRDTVEMWVANDAGGYHGPFPVQGAATDAAVAARVSEAGATRAALDARYPVKDAANTFTAKQVVPILQLGTGTEPDAILLTESESLNGRRVSVQPVNQGSTDRTSQIELLPGANVSQDATGPGMVTQTSILMFGKTGTHYERLLIMSRGKEFSITTSRRGDGQMRPILFQTSVTSDGVEPDSTTPVFSIRPDGTARVHTTLGFGNGDTTLTRFAAAALRTPGQFMADDTITARRGTAQEVRIGNAGGFGVPAVAFGNGTGGTDSYILRVGASHLRTTGRFEIDGDLDHDGAAVGFYGVPAVARQTLASDPTPAEIRTVLLNLGFVQ